MNLRIFVRTAVAPTVLLTMGLCTGLNVPAQLIRAARDTWKEEVLLHDGQKIIVERSQSYGGRHQLGQSPPVKEHTIRFTLPNSRKQLSWTSEYGDDLGSTNFNLLALHVKDGVPFLITEPNLCLSYNKWGRPNPPYIIFKYEDGRWRRISLAEVPIEFKTVNLIVNIYRQSEIKEASQGTGYTRFERVSDINENLRQSQYKEILRAPVSAPGCAEYSSGPKAPFPIPPTSTSR